MTLKPAVSLKLSTMNMNTTANEKCNLVKHSNTLYELQLRYVSGKGRLTVSRTFDESKAQQRRKVETMKPGHMCNAECKWLVNVVKNRVTVSWKLP